MKMVAIIVVGWMVVISLTLFTVVMSRRDKVGERLGRMEGHLRVGRRHMTIPSPD